MRNKPIFTTDEVGHAEVLALKKLADWQDAALSVHLRKKNERIKELESENEALRTALNAWRNWHNCRGELDEAVSLTNVALDASPAAQEEGNV